MTTQELKSYIDRILGNNIRLLLPSYWWKRAFGAVIDKVDEKVEKSDLKTINGESVLGEGDLRVGVKSVESVEALEKLDAEVGDIASVLGKSEPSTVKYVDCYLSVDYENDWDKYTIIRGVEENSQTLPESGAAVYLTASNEALSKDCVVVGYIDYTYAYMKYTNGKDEFISLQQANELLASGKYRAAIGFNASDIDLYFTFYTKVAEDTADAYIKGETWKRLADEEYVDEKVAALEENGTGGDSGALRWWLALESFGIVNTPEQVAENIATYNKLIEDKYANVILCYGFEVSSMAAYTSAPVNVNYAILEGKHQIKFTASIVVEEGSPMECIAILPYQDGTMEVSTWEVSTSASNGPLTVWIPIEMELTEEQIAENAIVHAKIANGYSGAVILNKRVDIGDGVVATSSLLPYLVAGAETEGEYVVGFILYESNGGGEFYLYADGTVEQLLDE